MHKRNITTILGGIAVAIAASACGGAPLPPGMTDDELSLAPDSLLVECSGAIDAVEPEGLIESLAAAIADPPYKKNPDVECVLISKYNGDIDGGFGLGSANYGNFKACMQTAGCFVPGLGTYMTRYCDTKLKECQRHLIGAGPAGDLEVDRDHGTLTADDWRKFGKGLGS